MPPEASSQGVFGRRWPHLNVNTFSFVHPLMSKRLHQTRQIRVGQGACAPIAPSEPYKLVSQHRAQALGKPRPFERRPGQRVSPSKFSSIGFRFYRTESILPEESGDGIWLFISTARSRFLCDSCRLSPCNGWRAHQAVVNNHLSSAFSPEEDLTRFIAVKHPVDVSVSGSLRGGIGFFHLLSPAFPTARARPAPKGGTAGLLRSAQENTSPLGPLCLPAGNSVRGGAPLRAPLRPALPVLGQA